MTRNQAHRESEQIGHLDIRGRGASAGFDTVADVGDRRRGDAHRGAEIGAAISITVRRPSANTSAPAAATAAQPVTTTPTGADR